VDTLSPAYALRDHLRRRGARVTLEDPYYSAEDLRSAGFEAATFEGAGLVILNTGHPEFADPDFTAWRAAGVEAVLDGRNIWQRSAVESAGLLYFGIGRSSRSELEGDARLHSHLAKCIATRLV
jgi:UDP-N-acetyl-D-mannosaminuronate dehydrogenase